MLNRLNVCWYCNPYSSLNVYIDNGFITNVCINSIKYAKHAFFFSMIQPFLIKKWFLGWPCDPITQCIVFKYLITAEKKNRQVIRVNPSANIARLCTKWNKCDAISYFWSYFLIRLQRMDFVVILPMDLLHLFHWPRLLQLNVHQFVRISWLSLFVPLSDYPSSFFSLSSVRPIRCATMHDYNFTPGLSSSKAALGIFHFSLLSSSGLPTKRSLHVFIFVTICCTWMRRNCSRLTASNETLYAFISGLYHFLFVVKIVFRYPLVNNIADENECEKSNENLTMI